MPVDPGLFMQAAQLQIASRNQLGNDLTNAIKIYQDSKTKGFDLKKLAEQGLYEYSATGKTTPERMAAIQALDTLEGPKTTYSRDESGALVPTTQPSIMDRISQIGPKQYTPSFPPLGSAPVTQEQTMTQQPVGVLNAIPALSMGQLEQPMPRMGGMPPAALTQQQQDALNARGDVMNRSAPALPQITAPAGAGPKTIQLVQEKNIGLMAKQAEQKLERESESKKPIGLEQGKVATFADRMMEANNQLQELAPAQTSLIQRNVANLPLGNYATSSEYKKAQQAERNFINAVLRRESGAVISPEEFANARQQYFPQPGDDESVMQQKAINRQTVIEGFTREAGPSYTPKDKKTTNYKEKYGLQ